MTNCKVFNSPKFGEIRTTKDCNGEPLFIAIDVARALFSSGPDRVLRNYCKHVVQVPNPICPKRKIYSIGVSDVGRLIIKSKKQYSLDFYDWIHEKVLPKLRSTSFDMGKDEKTANQTKVESNLNRQEHIRNDEKASEAELILRLAEMNLSNERRIVALEKHVEDSIGKYAFSKDIDQYYSTIAGYIQRFKLPILVSQYASYGSRASDICKRRGVETSKISDVRYGTINLYPNYILQELFKDYFNK